LRGQYWKVTELCKHAIRNDPGRAKYYHLMATSFAHHPRFLDDAEQCFLKAIELEPKEIDYRVSLCRFLLQQGLLQRALEECNQVLEIEPEHPEIVHMQRELAEKIGAKE